MIRLSRPHAHPPTSVARAAQDGPGKGLQLDHDRALGGDHDEVDLAVAVPPYLEVGQDAGGQTKFSQVPLEASQEIALAMNVDWLAEEDLDDSAFFHPLPPIRGGLARTIAAVPATGTPPKYNPCPGTEAGGSIAGRSADIDIIV